MSALADETLHDSTTFEHLGRSWTIPTKRNAAHLIWMQREMRLGIVASDLMAAQAFLDPAVSKANQQKPDQFKAFLDLEPDDGQLEEFSQKLSKALGLDETGNS